MPRSTHRAPWRRAWRSPTARCRARSAGHRFIDVLIHGWDLAKATGQNTKLDAGLVEACWEVVTPQAELLKGSGMFGDDVEVPPDADPQTRLLALLGRRD